MLKCVQSLRSFVWYSAPQFLRADRFVSCVILPIIASGYFISIQMFVNSSVYVIQLVLDVTIIVGVNLTALNTCRFLWRQSRVCRVAIKNRFCLCPHCLYTLHPAVLSGQCPECGRSFSQYATREMWKQFVRSSSRAK